MSSQCSLDRERSNVRRCWWVSALLSVTLLVGACGGRSIPSYSSSHETPEQDPALIQAVREVGYVEGPGHRANCPNSYSITMTLEGGGEPVGGADEVYRAIRIEVFGILEIAQKDESFDGYSLYMQFNGDMVVDRYGNPSDSPFFSVCYTADDIAQMNLPAMSDGRPDILRAGRIWEDNVRSVFGR